MREFEFSIRRTVWSSNFGIPDMKLAYSVHFGVLKSPSGVSGIPDYLRDSGVAAQHWACVYAGRCTERRTRRYGHVRFALLECLLADAFVGTLGNFALASSAPVLRLQCRVQHFAF